MVRRNCYEREEKGRNLYMMRRPRWPCFLAVGLTSLPRGRESRVMGLTHKCPTLNRSRKFSSMISSVEINSSKNAHVKEARALLNRRHREKSGKIILEGRRLIIDALQKSLQPYEFFYTKQALERNNENASLPHRMQDRGARNRLVTESVIRSFSDTVNPQGLVGIFGKPEPCVPSMPTMTLICDEVHDPGNLGSLLRCAAAAGVQFVVLTPSCADVWGLKALRAGMGAQFRIPVYQGMSWVEISECMARNKSIIRVAEGCALQNYSQVDWTVPSALVVGSEAHGPSESAIAAAHESIGIPMTDEVESLNVAMAGAVVLFEAKRQRDQKSPISLLPTSEN